MFDIVRAFHEALHIESTFWFVVVIAASFAVMGGGAAWVVDRGYKNTLAERPVPRAHLHITSFHFTAPQDPGGHATAKIVFVNNGDVTAEVMSGGRMAFFIPDGTDRRTREEFETSLFADVPEMNPRNNPLAFLLSRGTDRSVTLQSSPWAKDAIDAFMAGRADLYAAGKLFYADGQGEHYVIYCTYMKPDGQQFFSPRYNDEP